MTRLSLTTRWRIAKIGAGEWGVYVSPASPRPMAVFATWRDAWDDLEAFLEVVA
ncbi:hypothetical protein [Rhodococcus sp. UNC363MFTsu5.1]|uniref:hypothetical protein n=1 Tax=Rhodococcus sp. UNC363MFTsu5.1 TaxID=1449069 RepID=UPI000A446154|nr:hypothetical protein [Rhodococcus sp. UNC363MFTsu5.1]